jgi:hypothetical protein
MSIEIGRSVAPIVATVVLASLTGAAWSQQDPRPAPANSRAAPSKEMREKLATVHERTAACLRSDKSFSECRSEMMKSCREILGGQGCPSLGRGMNVSGRPATQTPPASAGAAKQ